MHRNIGAKNCRKDISELARAVREFSGGAQAADFLRELLTPAEIENFALRWRLLKMLESGAPQRKIAEELGISLCKITRGSRILKNKDSRIKQALRGLK